MEHTPPIVVPRVTRPTAATTLYYAVHGYHAALTIPDRAARSLARSILRGFGPLPAAPDESVTDFALRHADRAQWEVTVADQIVYRSTGLVDAVAALEWQLITNVLADQRHSFHLHAAALASPATRTALLIVGESGSGKTTLTLGLMARGFLPYNDDITLIAPATCAPLPFRRAFHVDARTQALVTALPSSPPWDVGGAPAGYFLVSDWATASWPIRTVLFPRLAPGEMPRLDPLSVTDAALRLLTFSMTLSQSSALALQAAGRIVERAQCSMLVSGDLAATLDLVIDQVVRDHGRRDRS